MEIVPQNRDILIKDIKDFEIDQTLECGQSFHFDRINEDEYIVIAHNRMLRVRRGEKNSLVLYDTSYEEYKSIWEDYFDLGRDYSAIKEYLLSRDERLAPAIEAKYGVRIMHQEFFEMLMSFIISQNKQIPQIKKLVFAISEKWGTYVGTMYGKDYYAFPTPKQLEKVSAQDFKELKTGFRAPYLYDALSKVLDGSISEEGTRKLDNEALLNYLCGIKGVGEKVASCVMLFGLSRRDAFPVDVWIKRIMEEMYFENGADKKKIAAFARDRFGEYGGYAQQYLFYYARDGKK